MTSSIDASFLDLPRAALADAALERAATLGAEHADVRIGRTRSQSLRVRDARLEGANDDEDQGLGVRFVVDGTWGFAATEDLSTDAAARAAEQPSSGPE